MRKIFRLGYFLFPLVSILVVTGNHNLALAEKDGGEIIFPNTKMFPAVVFSHKKHSKAGNECADCHDKIFQKVKGKTDEGNAITMKAIKKGKFCGSCHNGVQAFKVRDSCPKCHSKKN